MTGHDRGLWADDGRRCDVQGLILQISRIGFLILLWLFVYATIRALRNDLSIAGGRPVSFGLPGARAPARSPRAALRATSSSPGCARQHPHLARRPTAAVGSRRRLHPGVDRRLRVGAPRAPVAPRRRLVRRRPGSTNGTYLDRAKVTTAVRVPTNTPIRIGKTVIELRP